MIKLKAKERTRQSCDLYWEPLQISMYIPPLSGDADGLSDMPFEDPPPYTERDLMKLEQELARQNRLRLEEGRG